MDMDKTKRERSANFSLNERDILVLLVQKYKNVLENKQSDATTWKKKEAAWECIEKEFNARSGSVFRSSKTLKIKYEGLKRTVRKKSAVIRSELYRTGGGKNTAPPLDIVEEQVKELITLSTDGLESLYDSDMVYQDRQEYQDTQLSEIPSCTNMNSENDGVGVEMDIEIPETEPLQTIPENVLAPEFTQNMDDEGIKIEEGKSKKLYYTPTSSSKKWDVTSRKNLKSKKHPALIANLPKKVCLDDLTEAKMELVSMQKALLESEIREKKKICEFEENERIKESKRREDEHKWKEEEYLWKKEESRLRIEKLKQDLSK